MSEERDGWRECADPVELAAAVAAGVEVQRNWGYDWQPGTNNETAEQFAGSTKANCRYRVPASWSWSPEPPAPDDLVSRARRHAETHPESRELIEELLEELLEAVVRWACFAAPPPVPSWPGAVLSGLVDEDGQPTWLAQAGNVRGEQVRARTDRGWDDYDGYIATAWVEVRAPRPAAETERVPVTVTMPAETADALMRYLRDGGFDNEGVLDDVEELLAAALAPDGTVEVLRDGAR